LKALLLKSSKDEIKPVFPSEKALDLALTNLEDKGLLGWDRKANRYDLHPIVRGVVWNNLDADKQYEIHGSLRTHFEAMPVFEDHKHVESIEDLRPVLELYNSLIQMKLFEEATNVFYNQLSQVTLYRLSATNLRVELLEQLFVDGIDKLPRLNSKNRQGWVLGAIATGYDINGQLNKSIPFYKRSLELRKKEKNYRSLAIVLSNYSDVLRLIGRLFKAEIASKQGLRIAEKIKDNYPGFVNLNGLGLNMILSGKYDIAEKALKLSLEVANNVNSKQWKCLNMELKSKLSILKGEYKKAKGFADQSWELAAFRRNERDFIGAAYLQGLAALQINDLTTANERLHHAIKRIRTVQLIEEELQLLIALAEYYLKKNFKEKAREQLDEVWDLAEHGPYPIFHADALNILAEIEITSGNNQAAVTAATQAYQKAWCDGPPYAYHFGLEKAKKLLKELGAPEPEMPPFNSSKFEPMPEIEIDSLDSLLQEEEE